MAADLSDRGIKPVRGLAAEATSHRVDGGVGHRRHAGPANQIAQQPGTSGIAFYGSVVSRITSFDVDLRRAFDAGGSVGSAGWTTWDSLDLGDFLLRLLAAEAVVGHGPCVVSDDVPAGALRPFELLPPVAFPDESAGLVGVVATDRWFGVFLGDDHGVSIYAAPVERVQHDLAAIAPGVSWMEL